MWSAFVMTDRPWSGGARSVGVIDVARGTHSDVRESTGLEIRRARPSDGPALLDLFDAYARLGLVLPRTPETVYRHLREYVVAVEDGTVVGCAGLRVYHPGLAEVVGVAVADGQQGRGIGRRVVEAVVEEAREFGIGRVFALTLQESFFKQLGFRVATRDDVPEKKAADEAEGIDRTHCRKSTVIMDLDPSDRAELGEN